MTPRQLLQLFLFLVVFAFLMAAVALVPARAAPPAPKVCRSAMTGKVITAAQARANPATTVCARRKPVRR